MSRSRLTMTKYIIFPVGVHERVRRILLPPLRVRVNEIIRVHAEEVMIAV